MGCLGCKKTISGYCKVCELLDNDKTVKIVTYCETCGVYICKECNGDLLRRLEAFIKAKL
jgi:hypothetical protein